MDKTKVIKAVEEAFDLVHSDYIGTYDFDETEWEKNKADALLLLKEQEAVEPVTESSVYDPDTWFFVCGSCKKSVIDRGDKFCRWCGRSVKWE